MVRSDSADVLQSFVATSRADLAGMLEDKTVARRLFFEVPRRALSEVDPSITSAAFTDEAG